MLSIVRYKLMFYLCMVLKISDHYVILSAGRSTNVVLPLMPNNDKDAREVYNFNFPKEGVYIFKNPTIINFERKDKISNMTLPDGSYPMHPTKNISNAFVLCKLFQVSYFIIFNC